MRTLTLIKSIISLRVKWEMAFRTNAILGFLAQVIYLFGSLISLSVLFANVDTIGGWTRSQCLALVATLELLQQVNLSFFRQGIRSLPSLVQRGYLDTYLIRPCWPPILIVLKGIDITGLWRCCLGIGILFYSINIGSAPTLVQFLGYLLSFIFSLAILVLLNVCLACLSFWLIEVNNLYFLIDDLSEFARYPDSIYHGVIKSIFTTILPLVLLSSFPVRILTNAFDVHLLIQQALVLAFFGGLASVLWHFGLKHYQGASS